MIEQLELTNFKNFRSATLPLGKFTVIVGTNASGKSNLRDAFRFVHGISRGYSLADTIGEKWGNGGELLWKGVRGGLRDVCFSGTNAFGIRVSLRVPARRTEVRAPYRPYAEGSPPPMLYSESRAFRGMYALDVELGGQRFRHLAVAVNRERLWIDEELILEATQDRVRAAALTLAVPTLTPEWEQLFALSAALPVLGNYPLRMAAIPASMKFADELTHLRFFDLSPDSLREPSIPGQIVLGDRGENLSSVMLAICEDAALKASVLEWVRQLTPLDVIDFEFEPDAAGRVLVKLVEGNGQKTSALSASDGTLRFLAMLAALYGPNAAGFYFFDEIETGIHPTRLHLLIQLIEQRVARGDVQVVATTHSPQLLGLLNDESREAAVLTYRLEGHPEGRIKRIMDIPSAAEVLKEQSLIRLHESGWLENAVEFLEGEEGDT